MELDTEKLVTFAQSTSEGFLTFWFWIRKSITGPGCTIIVVDKSVQDEPEKNDLIWSTKTYATLRCRSVPMFKDRPPWVARKLEWKPRHPRTPPPKSVKFCGSLWKNDCRTKRQPLQPNKWNYYVKAIQMNIKINTMKNLSPIIYTVWMHVAAIWCRALSLLLGSAQTLVPAMNFQSLALGF